MTLATYKSHRPRGLASWKPQTKSRALLHDVEEVLHEYVDLLPLTLRQIFYRLVGTRDYPKNEAFYDRLLDKLARAQRYALPGAPAKKNDKRGDDWIVDAVQAEALDPATLAAEVRAAIGAHLDLEKLQDVLDQEQEDRSELIAHVEELGL